MSLEDQRAKDLFRTLAHSGFKRDRSQTRAHCFTGKFIVASREVSVEITFCDLEFTRLPKLTLLNPDEEAPNVVAHLEASGALCFARNEDLVLDRYDVGGTAVMCLELAHRGLERVLTHGTLDREIAQEFPQHWLGDSFYYDVAATEHMRAKLYTVPRDGAAALLLLTDHKDKLKRLVLADAYRRTIVNSSRPAFVFISHNDLTFWRDARQPNTLADFLAWLETMVPHGGDKAIHELSASIPILQYYCSPMRQTAASVFPSTLRVPSSEPLSAGKDLSASPRPMQAE